MTSKNKYRKQVESFEKRIKEHRVKIESEMLKASPDLGLIEYWKKEIKGKIVGLKKSEKRLKRK